MNAATRKLQSVFTSLMFQWTSINEWLHPAVPPVKTLPFFGKYFRSAIIASICSNTIETLAVSLQLSEFTAKRVANVCAWAFTCLLCCNQQGGKQRFEKSVELERRGECDKMGRASCNNSATHTSAHCSYLMAGLTELNFADELSAQTQFESFPQKNCKQKNRAREFIVHCWEI